MGEVLSISMERPLASQSMLFIFESCIQDVNSLGDMLSNCVTSLSSLILSLSLLFQNRGGAIVQVT